MATKQSAGILLYRLRTAPPASPAEAAAKPGPEVFLVHPGGPYWKKKDAGTWTIPKGEFTEEEPALDAAIREFREERPASSSKASSNPSAPSARRRMRRGTGAAGGPPMLFAESRMRAGSPLR